MQRLFLTALLVRDYDEAIDYFVRVLDFEVRIDQRLSDLKRWVVLAPAGGGQGCILLARADTDRQRHQIGDQSGGRVFLFIDTDDLARDYAKYAARGVSFVRPPQQEDYGMVAVFEDLYGNRWDLIQHTGYFGIQPGS
ncbi:VOC family protein [Bradyrhizobium genosp. L]|uniref:VOC family protein n=1 Tax=Bradyrhizobium genosp. L TaxID=83637 RepID=UPI0018A2C7BB|nr:VOC family protein [Bradyrhizobium genosp. L]QPF82482.1 VOC family protein [Bradyrhizobium genosp. L]